MPSRREKFKKWIKEASYETMLRRWRFSPATDVIFQGPFGEHYHRQMNLKRDALSADEQVAVSKRVGWRP